MRFVCCVLAIWCITVEKTAAQFSTVSLTDLKKGFSSPPDESRPGVYWYFMDGNLSREGMTADLEAMKAAGMGTVLFLEVNVGIPRGKVDFLSAEWKSYLAHAVHECERLGMSMALGIGPGWNGSGGPWVPADQSMQHLVSSHTTVSGGRNIQVRLPLPKPMTPYFGEDVLTDSLRAQRDRFYEDVKVLAFPAVDTSDKIKDIHERALFYRHPYTSVPGVAQFMSPVTEDDNKLPKAMVTTNSIIDLTSKVGADGLLNWDAPAGNWTILRFGRRNNGSVTRPAPIPGLGFESDKLDSTAIRNHLAQFTDQLLKEIGPRIKDGKTGLTTLHIDSWEMGSQNWTKHFSAEFQKRRGYDPTPYLPAYSGYIVESREITDRFLWDVRQTVQELILTNHVGFVKNYSHQHGLKLSIEPYDMNPSADLELGSVPDIPVGEFWSNTYNSAFSCIEAASIAHVDGKPVVGAESFTGFDGYKEHPNSMKNRGDWAFATGINKFLYHTYVHQPFASNRKPGMTMGTIGIQWNRNQTWWPMIKAYHTYISRCQYMLQQGRPVADILYLTPETAPMAFKAPSSAITGNDSLPDKKGYSFDGSAPSQLYNAGVVDGRIVFPGGAAYELLVLPAFETITPTLLRKIKSLVVAGATVVGSPSKRSPSLTNYPFADEEVQKLNREIWGGGQLPFKQTTRQVGKGRIIWGGDASSNLDNLYPAYEVTAGILASRGIGPDFEADSAIRYIHRKTDQWDIYFVSNRTNKKIKEACIFRIADGKPALWNAVTGEIIPLPVFTNENGKTKIPMEFDGYQSFFIVFEKGKSNTAASGNKNFPSARVVKEMEGAWAVSFDTSWGGPDRLILDTLQDWSKHHNIGVKYYSGIAKYRKQFRISSLTYKKGASFWLSLGEVHAMAKVYLNGVDLGVVWTDPMGVDITKALKKGDNELVVEVANLWVNRLIGDEALKHQGLKPFSFSTYGGYSKDSRLVNSGLIGPVTIQLKEY